MKETRIDWEEIHRRIDRVNGAIARGWAPSPEEERRILRQRAEILAREAKKEAAGDRIEVVEFLLAGEHYGIESHCIREVYPLKDYTHLPGVPPFVFGLVNVRGRVISIIDLKKFFDLPQQGISDLNKIIIINNRVLEFGILADAILGVRNIAVSELRPPLPTLTGIREEYLKGVTGERMVVLDADRILADGKVIVHEDA